jgi:hypothetical protein
MVATSAHAQQTINTGLINVLSGQFAMAVHAALKGQTFITAARNPAAVGRRPVGQGNCRDACNFGTHGRIS